MPVCADLQFSGINGVGTFHALSLLDTGNSFKSLISREILEKNNIPYCPVNLSAYSVDLKLVKIIGKVELFFKFVGSDKEFKELFFVPDITSKIVNLGSHFLCSNKINLLLDQNKLSVHGEIIPLHTDITEKTINEFHKIPEISGDFEQELPQKPDLPGLKLGANGSGELHAQRFICRLHEKTDIYPGGTIISVKLNGADTKPLWYISPNQSKMTSKNGIMLIEGVYQPKPDGTCLVNVVNSSHKKITLLAGVKVGQGFELDLLEPENNNNIIGEVKSKKEISGTDLHNRIKFIKDKLKLDDNVIIKNQPDVKAKLIKIALDHFDIFSLNESDIGNCDLLQYDIELTDEARPVKARNIPLNPEYENRLKEQIENWLSAGVISEGLSELNSPIFAVRKKPAQPGGEGKLRFVIDFRLLNNFTKRVSWPLPLISDNLNRLGKGQIFSTLDLTAAYHAMALTESCKPYTAFSANGRQYIFQKLPFGLCNAPSIFCLLMDRVLSLLPGMYAYVISYLDDLIIFSGTTETHLEHISNLFQVLKRAGLKLNLGKCAFFQKECTYLGHIVSADGLKMNPEYLDRIKDWSKPKTGKELQKFLGFSNYYRSYFAEYSKKSWPLDSHRNDTLIDWTDDLNKVWEEFKNMFNHRISKGYPEWDNPNPFVLDVDFSAAYFAGVISQKQNGVERIIGIASKKCNAAESNYPSYKGELACLVYTLKQFLHFCRFRPFMVRTDSISLVHYKKWGKSSINGVTYRWISFIQSFDFTVIHRKGAQHINADALSRANFDCKKHKILDCEECVDNSILDPYLTTSPVQDQIFELHGLDNLQVGKSWNAEIQKDSILNEIRTWILERRVLTPHEKSMLSGRKEMLYNLMDHLYIAEGIIIFRQPLPSNQFIERPVVPIGLYNSLFELAHSGYSSGHKGIHETIKKINDIYFMPGVNKFVESRINNCIGCLKKIGQLPKHKTKITHSAQNAEVFGCVSMDLIGPLTECFYQGQKVKHILIMVCLFSRYVFTVPIKDTSAECTVRAILDHFIPVHGLFKKLRSDRGTNFTSKVFRGVMDELNIKTDVVPPRNPNSNPVERYNQSIYSALRVDGRFPSKDWAHKLGLATLIINCSKSQRTGYSPFFIAMGRQPILPLNLVSPVDTENQPTSSRSYLNFVRNLEQIIANISKKSKTYLEFKNKSRKNKEALLVNDVCYAFFNLAKNDVSKKLQSYYTGPFMVIHRFSDSLYELQPIGNCPVIKNQVIGRDKIRKIVTQTDIMGEKLPFNIHPAPEICPSEEITLEFNNSPEKLQDNVTCNDTDSFSEDDFSYLTYDNSSPHPGDFEEVERIGENHTNNENHSQTLQESIIHNNIDKEGGSNSKEQLPPNLREQLPTPQRLEETKREGERLEKGTSEKVKLTCAEKAPEFLSSSLPNEQSFFDKRPAQSSPARNIKVSSHNLPAKYLWDATRKLRSTGSDNKIHLSLDYQPIKNPLKSLKSLVPFKRKK